MPAIIRGIKNRKIASAIIAIRESMSRDSVDPLKGSISITTSNIDFVARIIEIMPIHYDISDKYKFLHQQNNVFLVLLDIHISCMTLL